MVMGVDYLRAAKHRLWILEQKTRFQVLRLRGEVYRVVGRRALRHPYDFDVRDFPHTFIARSTSDSRPSVTVPRRVFVVWTGDNDLTPNRTRNLATLRAVVGVPVVLVTPSNLAAWIVPSHPLHPSYEHLSLSHRSDYLRAYLLHHHGGGYMDIKEPIHSWAQVFDRVQDDHALWYVGAPEPAPTDLPMVPGKLGRRLWTHWGRVANMAAGIARAGSPLTHEWIMEIEQRMTGAALELSINPGGVGDEVAGYPLAWTEIGSTVLLPLQLKYMAHVRNDARLDFSRTGYR